MTAIALVALCVVFVAIVVILGVCLVVNQRQLGELRGELRAVNAFLTRPTVPGQPAPPYIPPVSKEQAAQAERQAAEIRQQWQEEHDRLMSAAREEYGISFDMPVGSDV